jgi:hypothetical protein
LRLPFFIYTVQGDGELHFVVAVQTFNDATARVRELGEVWQGEYARRKLILRRPVACPCKELQSNSKSGA